MPESSATAKQLASSLKATDRTVVVFGDSIGGRTFILAAAPWPHGTGFEVVDLPRDQEGDEM
jgi:hypothetical protein